MCGIFGLIANTRSNLGFDEARAIVETLFLLSESRGKESSGIAVKLLRDQSVHVLKKSIPAGEFIKTDAFNTFFKDRIGICFESGQLKYPFALVAHARLVTNGSQENNNNNQPVVKQDMVAVHNGIITNVDSLWAANTGLQRELEVDTEVFLALISGRIKNGKSHIAAIQETYQQSEGTISTGILYQNYESISVCSNNASLYLSHSDKSGMLLFASENFILQSVIEKHELQKNKQLSDSTWSEPFTGLHIHIPTMERKSFKLNAMVDTSTPQEPTVAGTIMNHSPDIPIDFNSASGYANLQLETARKLLQFNLEAINKLKRCTRCLLPETFPFIRYSATGVCNYCDCYIVKKQGSKEEEFKELLKSYRSKDGKPDCIIPFSGGRDSSYGLHYVVKELGMHPITYTYDWGMVTDLARRNIARVCGKLGIENIIVSADIAKKRENIRKNVEAWLKNPQLGIIPLFMAGDKQFFYYVNQIKKQTGIKLDIWSTNILENTDFKVGFCGVSPSFDKTRPDYLPMSSKMKMAMYYLKNFMVNPAYLNTSIYDTLWSFYSYYAEPRTHFYQLFDYIKWDENKIEKTLFEEYNWELSPDTTTSWRIGDGTAAFYNYIYYTVAGFSEFDTFRSNQIREGLITREQGLKFIEQENRPRFESMIWYLETIGVDFERAVKTVNNIPKLYSI